MMRPIPPGEVLREQLEELGMSATQLAGHLDVPPNRITHILNAERALTADTALRLSKFFGTTAEFWLALQSNYDLRKAELAASPAAKIKPLWQIKTLTSHHNYAKKPSARTAAAFMSVAEKAPLTYAAKAKKSAKKSASAKPRAKKA